MSLALGRATGAERNRRERNEFVGSLGSPRNSQHCDLVVFLFWTVLAIGLVTVFLRGEWQKARGLDKVILFGPLFYAAPLAAFGTEHFTLTKIIASLIPELIPWHLFWAYFVGACFIAAALSLVTKIQARLAAGLLALTFFLFVVLMDAPGLARKPQNRFSWRSCCGNYPSVAALWRWPPASATMRGAGRHILATIARYFVAIPVVVYSVEQFMHGDHVPGIPLRPLTPPWGLRPRHLDLPRGRRLCSRGSRVAGREENPLGSHLGGLTVLFVEFVVYVPIGIVERASLDKSLNYFADTLMFCGTVLMLAGAMPRKD